MNCLYHEFDVIGINMLVNAMAEIENMSVAFTIAFKYPDHLFSDFCF